MNDSPTFPIHLDGYQLIMLMQGMHDAIMLRLNLIADPDGVEEVLPLSTLTRTVQGMVSLHEMAWSVYIEMFGFDADDADALMWEDQARIPEEAWDIITKAGTAAGWDDAPQHPYQGDEHCNYCRHLHYARLG